MNLTPVFVFVFGNISGFFDFYIVPLTKKLKECGVFGVSSDEYLSYAQKNREEWIARGEAVVETLSREAKKKFGVKGNRMPLPVKEPTPLVGEEAPIAKEECAPPRFEKQVWA